MGTGILFRGEMVKIEPAMNEVASAISFGGESAKVPAIHGDLRPFCHDRHIMESRGYGASAQGL